MPLVNKKLIIQDSYKKQVKISNKYIIIFTNSIRKGEFKTWLSKKKGNYH